VSLNQKGCSKQRRGHRDAVSLIAFTIHPADWFCIANRSGSLFADAAKFTRKTLQQDRSNAIKRAHHPKDIG
jgi:hypothetical protein